MHRRSGNVFIEGSAARQNKNAVRAAAREVFAQKSGFLRYLLPVKFDALKF
jgi:hypothetical protein